METDAAGRVLPPVGAVSSASAGALQPVLHGAHEQVEMLLHRRRVGVEPVAAADVEFHRAGRPDVFDPEGNEDFPGVDRAVDLGCGPGPNRFALFEKTSTMIRQA